MSPSLSSIRVVPAAGPAAPGIGKYRYIAELASGGMATVFLAVTKGQRDFEKLVVIKELHGVLAQDPTFVTMFTDEARLAARLNHPNIVQTLEVGSEGDRHFIAMEFLDGVPYVRLARMRSDRIPPPIPLHVRVLCEVLHGLHEAHELRDFDGKPLNVVHRDVSPQNIMMTFAGSVKVLDFGIAKAALAVEQRPEDFKGKLEYMAPEQAILANVDRRADLFAVGVMLWEAIARRRLYEKGEDKLARLVSGQLPDLLEVRPDAPKRLAAICKKAMERSADDRYATALDMAHELEEWLDGTTQHVKNRDVGAFVTEKFGAIRQKIRAAVDSQLALFREMNDDDGPDTLPISQLPFVEVKNDPSEPPPPFVEGEKQAPDSEPGTLAMADAPGVASVEVMPDSFDARPTDPDPPALEAAAPALVGAHPTPAVWIHEAAGLSPEATHIIRPKKRSPAPFVAAAGAVLVATFVILGVYVRHRRDANSMEITQTVSSTTTANAGEGVAQTRGAPLEDIDWTVRASPPEAKIIVDGMPQPQNPASGRRPKDGAMHVVRVEADGYEPREEKLSFDKSVLVTMDLRPTPVATTTPTAVTRPADKDVPKTDPKKPDTKNKNTPLTNPRPKPVTPRPQNNNGLDNESGY